MALLNSNGPEALREAMSYASQDRDQLSDVLVDSDVRDVFATHVARHRQLVYNTTTSAKGTSITSSSSVVTVLSEGEQSAHSGAVSDLEPVFSHTDISSVLHQQPHLIQDLGAVSATEVSSDPEHLRFNYSLEPSSHKESFVPKKTVYREQDRFLPIANVARIMRNALPKNGKVSKDAKECMQECVSEFISFITSEACDKCAQEKRKTVTGDDILYAMATLGFDNYIEPLKLYLQKYREFTRAEKGIPRTELHSEDSSDLFGGAGSDGDTVTTLHTYSFRE